MEAWFSRWMAFALVGLGACGGVTSGSDGGGSDASDGGSCADAAAAPFEAGANACADDTPLLVGGMTTGFSTCSGGTLHRPAVVSCPNLLVEATVASCSDPSGTCKTVADCKDAGPVVACILDDSAIAGYCDCRAGCVQDSECGSHKICGCAAPIGECVGAGCTSDAQCGPGLLCASSSGAPGVGGGGSFVCQTRQDKCLTDNDCPSKCHMGARCSMSCAVDGKGVRQCVESCLGPGP